MQPRTGPRKAGYRSRDRARARRHRRWTRGCIRGSAYRSRAEDAVLRTCAAALNGLSVVPLPPSVVNADPDGVPLPEMLTFDGAARDSDSKVKAAILDWFNPDFHALGGVGFDVVARL